MRAGARPQLVIGICLLVLAASSSAWGQSYHTRTYIDADGLPSPDVRGVIQDVDGVLWVATRGGLVTYDGARWTPVDLGAGIATSRFVHLLRDASGRLWSVESTVPPRVVVQDGKGGWTPIASSEGPGDGSLVTAAGLTRVGDRDLLLLGDSEGRLSLWDGLSWRDVGRVGTGGHRVLSVTAKGSLFYAAGAGGLARLDAGHPGSVATLHPTQPDGVTLGVKYDPVSDQVWFVSSKSIGRVDEGGLHRLTSAALPLVHPLYQLSLEPDGRGGLYFAYPERVYHFDEGSGIETIERRHGLVAEGGTCLLLDREENLWIGSRRGMTKLVSRRFCNFTHEFGLLHEEVSAALETKDGVLVLGHPIGLTFMDAAGPERLRLTDDEYRGRTMDLAEGPDGSVWASCASDGLARVWPDRSVTWMRGPGDRPLNTVLVRGDSVLVGGFGGYYRVSGDTLVSIPLSGVDPDSLDIRRMTWGSNGTVYFACHAVGLIALRNGAVQRWSYPGRPGSSDAYTVLETSDGRVWVGAVDGLYHVSGDSLALAREHSAEGPLVEHPVYLLVEEPGGALWIGTDRGVFRWDGLDLRHFSVLNGLVGQETNRGAGLVDGKGRVWIGTDRGVSCYRADLDRARCGGPTITLLASRIGGRERHPYEPVSVSHGQGSLTQEFAAISFVDEDRLRVRSRLEGLETEWREHPGNTRAVHYDRLGPGNYRLHMEIIDIEGRSSGVVRTAWTTVRKPYWTSAWFYLLAGLGLLGMGLGTASYVGQRRYSRRLESEVRERTTELSQSTAAIAKEKERLAITLGRIADGVATADSEGRVVFLNPAAEALLGQSAPDAVGRPIASLFGPAADLKTSWSDLARSWHHGASPGAELTVTMEVSVPDRGERWLEASAAPFGIEGDSGGLVIAFRDVTERRRLDEEQARAQKLESLGVLAGGIAHDFNNLLTVVLGNLELLESFGVEADPRFGEPIREAQEAATRARSLTQQLLTFSRGGAPIRTVTRLATILRQSILLSLSGSEVRCELFVAPDLLPVDVDEGQMTQVFNNLLINSRQALTDGGGIRVSAFNADEGGDLLGSPCCVVVEVEDDGPGISDENRNRIFDPYFTTKERGTGLGLATVHSIIARHGGIITVESPPHAGARFRVALPPSEREIGPEAPAVRGSGDPHGRILVMDDDDAVRQIVVRLLDHLGHDGVGVRDGEAAIAAYREAKDTGRPFDVVFMDLTVAGGMGGIEAAQRVMALDPEARLIVMSGYSSDPVLAHPERFGFVDRVAKPIATETLRNVLREVMGTLSRVE